MINTSVTLGSLVLKNPIVAASGTIGFGREYAKYFDLSEMGAICVKGLTLEEKQGNPPPRIAETPSGMLNAIGLQNPGVDVFLQYELPFLRAYDIKVIANIAGSMLLEYRDITYKLDKSVDMIEVNISCPNVKEGGLSFGADTKSAAAVTRMVKSMARVPVMVKLSPNVNDIAEIARAVESEGADAISLINTLLGMRIDPKTRRPILKNNVGGLSGPAVLPVAVRCVWQVANAVKLPLLGMGGVASGADAVELMLAGATAVGVGTALFSNPRAPVTVLDGIKEYCEAADIQNVGDLVGGVRAWQ